MLRAKRSSNHSFSWLWLETVGCGTSVPEPKWAAPWRVLGR